MIFNHKLFSQKKPHVWQVPKYASVKRLKPSSRQCLFIHLFVCLFIYLFVLTSLFVCLFVYLSIYLAWRMKEYNFDFCGTEILAFLPFY